MGYTQTFGGELIFPSQTSYLAITTLVDVTLQWPIEQQIAGIDVVADFMDVDTGIGLNIDMPDARQASTGQKTTFSNVGANLYTVRDAVGGTIQTVAIGEQWVFVLTDNTTEAGTWSVFQMGSTVSVATAGPLAGFGIKAISTTLNQQIDSDVEASTPFTVVDGDRAQCLIYTSGAGTCNLPSPGAVGNDWFFMLRNSGTGTLNVVPPSGQIDGASDINLDPDVSTFIFTDGTDFFTVGLSVGSVIAFDFVSLDVSGAGDFILSGANLNRISYRLTGALSAIRKIVVPNTTQQYWIDNQTTGGFQLSVGTAAQTPGPTIAEGLSTILYCDATDVVDAVTAVTVSIPVTIAQGGTGATTVGGAQTALQVPPTSRNLTAGVAMTGGGDLSADRTFDFSGALDDLSDVTISAPATGAVLFKSAGDWLETDVLHVLTDGIDVRGLLNNAPSGGGNQDVHIDLENNSGVNVGQLSYATSPDLQLTNFVEGGRVDIFATITAGATVAMFSADPDASVSIHHRGNAVARTLVAASGGWEVDNQLTGGGFERVLTTGDIVSATFGTFISGLTAVNGNVNAEITETHLLGGLPDLVQLVLECTTGELGYSIGDQVVMNPTAAGLDEASGIHQAYNQVAYDTSDIFYVLVDEATLGLSIPDRLNPGQPAFATLTSWSMLVKAVRF